jgi:hypothetical protein
MGLGVSGICAYVLEVSGPSSIACFLSVVLERAIFVGSGRKRQKRFSPPSIEIDRPRSRGRQAVDGFQSGRSHAQRSHVSRSWRLRSVCHSRDIDDDSF